MNNSEFGSDEVQYVDLHGHRMAYRDAGSGEVLLLIHGMAGSSESWRSVLPQLARHHRVLAPDLLGHGRSDKPRTDYSLGAFAAGFRDFLDALGVSGATVVGHSLGGGVAMQFIYQHPEYCQRLILISSGGLGPDVGWILRLLSAPGAELVLPLIAPQPVLRCGDALGSWLERAGVHSPRGAAMWEAYSSFADRPTRKAFLRTLRSVVDYRGQMVSALNRLHVRSEVPTLLIWGEQDQIIPVEHGYEAQAVRLGSRLVVLPGVGHFPQVESPTKVVDAIEGFLNETPNPARHVLASVSVLNEPRERLSPELSGPSTSWDIGRGGSQQNAELHG
jgi:pimeloyl-ACP methyl ester carboxylesterase